MFDWLFEGRQSVYLALAALGVVVGGVWAWTGFALFRAPKADTKSGRSSERRLAFLPIVLGTIVLLAGIYLLLDRLVETGREQIARKLQEMARAVQARDEDRIFAHISESFSAFDKDKAAFTDYVHRHISQVSELTLWEISFPGDSGRVHFNAKPRGREFPQGIPLLVRGTLVRDPDGQWRLQTFQFFLPSDPSTPLNLP